MSDYSSRLNEALEGLPPAVDIDSFLKFASALLFSSHQDQVPAAIQRAIELPPAQLAQIISQVQYTGDLTAIKNLQNPKHIMAMVELAKKVLPPEQVARAIDVMGTTPETTEPVARRMDDPGDDDEEGEDEDYTDEGDDCDGHDWEEPKPDPDYDPEADYHTQGEDEGGH